MKQQECRKPFIKQSCCNKRRNHQCKGETGR